MGIKIVLLFCCLLSVGLNAQATVGAQKHLHVYGPGGPHRVLAECADLFRQRYGIDVWVTKAMPGDLERKLREDGDLYYGGAEYMLENLVSRQGDLLDLSTVTNLHPRRIGIIVRKGNPMQIRHPKDLSRDGIDLLDVKLEKMRDFHGVQGLSSNIKRFEFTGRQGQKSWRRFPELDAWVTYRSWHVELANEADFIDISHLSGVRFTPMARTRHTPYPEEAELFLKFLQTEEATLIFKRHGWY